MKLKIAILLVPIIGFIAMAAMFGKIGVRPKALPIIKPSGFDLPSEIGFWVSRQTRQKLFRNSLVLFGLDPTEPRSQEVLDAFVKASAKDGNGYDLVLGASVDSSGDGVVALVEPLLAQKQRVLLVMETPQSSRLLKKSLAKTLEFEKGMKFASISIISADQDSLESLDQSGICNQEPLVFENVNSLNCLFKTHRKKIAKEEKPLVAALDQFGLEDYLIYIHRR